MAGFKCPRCRKEWPEGAAACPACGAERPEPPRKPVPSDTELTRLVKEGAARGSAHKAGAPPPDLPDKLGPYRILEEIGRGGMGVILRGRDDNLRRLVAIKVLLPEAQLAEDNRLRFIEEAQITGQLEHPGIAPVHLLSRTPDGREYFSMKLVSGRTLEKILEAWHGGDARTRAEFPRPRLLSIFERVAETVSFAHSQGVIHRDLKPGNVMVGDYGETWVLDWGLAKVIAGEAAAPAAGAAGAAEPPRAAPAGKPRPKRPPTAAQIASVRDQLGYALTMDGTTLGTPSYMSPEQARGEALDPGADIFQLGGMLYEILTGEPPLQGATMEQLVSRAMAGQFVPVRRTRAGRKVPPPLAAIAEKCLARERRDRYASVAELLRDLRAWQAGEAVLAWPDSLLDRAWRCARRHKAGLAAAFSTAGLLLLTVAVAAVAVAASNRRKLQAERAAQTEAERADRAEAERERERAKLLQAELDKQKAQAELAARAGRRLRAFEPYAQGMDLVMRGQKLDEAAGLLRKALAVDAQFPEAQFALGEALRLSGLPKQAAEAYLKADELSQAIGGRPHLQAVIAAGLAYDGAGEYVLAEKAFLRAEQAGADDPLALVGKAYRICYRRGMNECRAIAEQALERGPHLWETHFAYGYALQESVIQGFLPRQPWLEKAIASFRQALELSPRQADPCIWLSRSLWLTGRPEARKEADELVARAMSLEPRNGNRHVMRVVARLEVGDEAGALQSLEQARQLGASNITLNRVKAIMAYSRGDLAEAYRLQTQLVRDTGEFPSVVGDWVILGLNLKKDAEVRPVFERWCRENPDYPEVFAVRAAMGMRAGDPKAAAAEARAGLKAAPYSLKLRAWLAQALYAQRDWKAALTAADQVLELNPRDFPARLMRASCLAYQNRLAEALAELDKAEKDFPAKAGEVEAMRKAFGVVKSPAN